MAEPKLVTLEATQEHADTLCAMVGEYTNAQDFHGSDTIKVLAILLGRALACNTKPTGLNDGVVLKDTIQIVLDTAFSTKLEQRLEQEAGDAPRH